MERYLVQSPNDFSHRKHVASCEGSALVRQLAELDDRLLTRDSGTNGGRKEGGTAAPTGNRKEPPVEHGPLATTAAAEVDDADMVVIEEDLLAQPGGRPVVAAVRLGDYRRLFARLRRGG